MSKSGFITIDRAAWDHQIFAPSPMSEREAWFWLITSAAWADTTHFVAGDLVPVPRGSFMVTLRELQKSFGWASDTKVRNYLKKLEKFEMIAVATVGKKNARKTHVTICNYSTYQSRGRTENAPETHEKRTGNAVKKQDNNITSKRDTNVSQKTMPEILDEPPPKKRRKPSVAIPPNWVMSAENLEYALSKQLTQDQANDEQDNFRDHHLSKESKFADWDAAWRTWVRNSIKFASNRRGAGRSKYSQNAPSDEEITRFAAENGRPPPENFSDC